MGGTVHRALVSDRPLSKQAPHLLDFLEHPLRPLSRKATAGFFKRASQSTLRFVPGFLNAVEQHLRRMEHVPAAD
jgi:DNA (cytosine-5)-methyltransferase 1